MFLFSAPGLHSALGSLRLAATSDMQLISCAICFSMRCSDSAHESWSEGNHSGPASGRAKPPVRKGKSSSKQKQAIHFHPRRVRQRVKSSHTEDPEEKPVSGARLAHLVFGACLGLHMPSLKRVLMLWSHLPSRSATRLMRLTATTPSSCFGHGPQWPWTPSPGLYG